jgi:hypothetical protein
LQGAAHILTKIYPICLRILAKLQELIGTMTECHKNDSLKDLAPIQNKPSGAEKSATPYYVASATDI